MGNVLLILLLLAAMGGALFMLVRGIITFLKTTEEDLKNNAAGPSQSSLKQNKAMMGRVMFQAFAILIVALLLLMKSGG
ncbi:HIG1 domain-containing protein [Sphingobium nicotianae]|uniref:HIG1 domain-containing protein n=1 Tax=Sphingobium nicotianae TaxID=2782607 RepID=A0A9X1DEG3_9SPHN|nr:HIG1 domain-containing protein [Sphingobium nicotianae]MBT2188421.1 HIG1 domain-containing protein [Sphingobium nicotianae]